MQNSIKQRIFAIVAAVATLGALDATAAITGVTTNPPSTRIALGQPANISLTWRVTEAFFAGIPPSTTVTSTSGSFRDSCGGSTTFGTVNTTLTSTKPGAAAVIHMMAETVAVPADIIFRAHKQGLSSFAYQRTFTPVTGSSTGCLTLDITSPSTAGFSISRAALSFDNGAPVRVVERKQPVRVNAEITFNGNGMMQGEWEVASPASTAGEPIFRSIASVRQYLVGSNTQTISSPTLPTDTAGLYLVRLRLTDPSPMFDIPVIRYFVTDPQTAGRTTAVPLGIVSPPNQTLLARDTSFAWEAVPNARVYQLEIYAKPRTAGDTPPGSAADPAPLVLPTTPPVTGMLVGDAQTRTALSDTARAHLVSGQSYLWRVLAIGADAGIVGESAVREVRMP